MAAVTIPAEQAFQPYYAVEQTPKVVAILTGEKWEKQIDKSRRVYDPEKVSPTICTHQGGGQEEKFLMEDLRIRKLTPRECFRLQGVKDEDIDKLVGISDSTKYHLAGDSIITTCLMAIFGEMLGIDWKEKVRGITNGWNKGTQRENDDSEKTD